MPPKDQRLPGGSRPPNRHENSALGERAEHSTARNPEQTLATALRIARFGITKLDRESGRGRAVFPVRSSGPRVKHAYKSAERSNGQPWGATTDPDLIRAYWKQYPDADIGMVTGDGLFVVDVDSVEGHGVDGFASLAALEQKIGGLS
ncbi:MAG: bifunctional DNA primase/polymerase [Xanthobacteraceae bacterium]